MSNPDARHNEGSSRGSGDIKDAIDNQPSLAVVAGLEAVGKITVSFSKKAIHAVGNAGDVLYIANAETPVSGKGDAYEQPVI